jgi:hypothetical protein
VRAASACEQMPRVPNTRGILLSRNVSLQSLFLPGRRLMERAMTFAIPRGNGCLLGLRSQCVPCYRGRRYTSRQVERRRWAALRGKYFDQRLQFHREYTLNGNAISITGVAFSSGGTLYGVTSSNSANNAHSLVTIAPALQWRHSSAPWLDLRAARLFLTSHFLLEARSTVGEAVPIRR